MYSSNPDNFQKFSTGPPYSQSVTTGVPVSSANQFYTDNSQSQSQSQPQPQPQPQPPILIQRKPRVPWSTGLCDCFVDVPNCCVTCWCPCITFGRIAEIVDKGSTSCGASGALYTLITCVIGCPCCYSCFYRSKMRQQYSLHESPCGDCLVHCCCESCSLCQEYRELQNRGFEMTIGWHGNVERQNRGMAMGPVPPAMEEGMSR